MKLGEIYEKAIEKGIKEDPRGTDAVKKGLLRIKTKYEKLSKQEREEFDAERLKNPYADTRILHGSPSLKVRNILVGIDIDVGELLLADRLNSRGAKIDLAISHHPSGKAYPNFFEVMYMQADIVAKLGVPIAVAEGLLHERIKEVERRVLPVNYSRAQDAARLLNIPFMCIHTPADNSVATFLQKLLNDRKPETVEDVVAILKTIPEYKAASAQGAGPRVTLGEPTRRAGRIFVDMTGGTEGSKNIFERLSQAGVDTIVCMHLSEDHFKEARGSHINVIIAGHISSDALGLNMVLDWLMKKDKLNIITCSGFTRFKR